MLSTRHLALFVTTFLIAYIGVSLLDQGAVNWVGALGGAVGILIAYIAIRYFRMRRARHRRQE